MTEDPVPGPWRQVLRGADRDAAIAAAADWCRHQDQVNDPLNTIADRYNISITAAAEAILKAGSKVA